MKPVERFIRYVKVDTQSSEESKTSPSTMKQLVLAELLKEELLELGVADARVNEFGIVLGSIASNVRKNVPSMGLIAHLDTALDVTGTDVKPRLIENYDGNDIVLNSLYTMKVSDFPVLKFKVGHKLVVTSGDTLLGADDKAGIAEIMSLVEYLHNHPEVEHGPIQIAFTPDEEVGRGTEHFDVKAFGAKFAYTVDGGPIEDVEYENFNAASAKVVINGISIHPGSAKGKMLNSQHVAMEFHSLLPCFDDPSFTEKYEGFNHLTSMHGSVHQTTMSYILRNHDKAKLAKQKRDFEQVVMFLNNRYGKDTVELTIQDTYQNMKEYMKNDMYVVEIAKQAISNLGLTPSSQPIRGGTDGASLTYQGLPCPNIGTGGYNLHGRYEFLDVNEMEQAIEVLKEIVSITVHRNW